ncbi:leucyl aminopeptidase family protein [Segnochrobactraceae bacterium EtOH-i3]
MVAAGTAPKPVPIHAVRPAGLDEALEDLPMAAAIWARTNRFEAAAGALMPLPGADGAVETVLFGLGASTDPLLPGALAGLPDGIYRLASGFDDPQAAVIAFLLGRYRFDTYRTPKPNGVFLELPAGVDADSVRRTAEAVTLVRDLVNIPANDLGPAELAEAARALAARHGAAVALTDGVALETGFPMVHAVGKGSSRPPRLIDITWGAASAPKVTLVGKGVCFDTGGLNLKPDSAMALMKKDMGGAAHVLGLASMIMDARLPVRLRVLIPAVENSVSGNAFRPGDILTSRKGLTVEIGNTDAEGRLILADALALADEEGPDLLIDMATLTGAARVALGPELPPLYSTDDGFAAELQAAGLALGDPMWRMPLWDPYQKMLDSRIADVNHITSGGFAGSITAALFLSRFVEKARIWSHLDIYAWTPAARPGRPEGGAAQTIRALFHVIAARFGGAA